MKLSIPSSLLVVLATSTVSQAAFAPSKQAFVSSKTTTALAGYLDNLNDELYGESPNPDVKAESREETRMENEDKDRYGPGTWKDFVDFDEFDGGDGQMGVAGDGNKGLEKAWKGEATVSKSKMMSAKNAWGTSSGYAAKLIEEGTEATRAQQFENWQNQQEVRAARNQHRSLTDDFDKIDTDDNWRNLSSFGGERNQDFDLEATLGGVVPGTNYESIVEMSSRINQASVFEFSLKNNGMGYADFRAAFSGETSGDWTISPTEGALSGREATDFLVRFRPQNPGVTEGHLVIDTEDDKWTWKLVGSTSM